MINLKSIKKVVRKIIKKLDVTNINFHFYRELIEYRIYGGFFENPRNQTAYDELLSKNYNEEREKLIDWKKENDAMIFYLNQLPDSLKILDIPFGTGRFVDYYLKKKFEIYGIDLSSNMLENSKNYLKENYNHCKLQIGDASKINYGDNFFDLVICFRFLPHIVSLETALKSIQEVSRVCSKYAIIQIGIRDKNFKRLRKPLPHEKMGTWFYENEINDLFLKNNLKVINKSEMLHGGVTMNKKFFKNPGGWYALLCEKIN
ncbi:MAG: class I SAM-dependent methyltransferase [Flavobacterium sp.]